MADTQILTKTRHATHRSTELCRQSVFLAQRWRSPVSPPPPLPPPLLLRVVPHRYGRRTRTRAQQLCPVSLVVFFFRCVGLDSPAPFPISLSKLSWGEGGRGDRNVAARGPPSSECVSWQPPTVVLCGFPFCAAFSLLVHPRPYIIIHCLPPLSRCRSYFF